MASLGRRQFQQLLFRSVVYPDLEHRKLGFEIGRPFLRRLKRWKYRLHPAIDFQAKALSHHKVGACDVAGLRLVRYRQRLFFGNSFAPSLSNHSAEFCRELPLQCKSNSQGDLIMANRPIFDMASRLHDFEPFHIANGLRCAGQGIPNGIIDTLFGRSYEFQDLVDMILHFRSNWHDEPPL